MNEDNSERVTLRYDLEGRILARDIYKDRSIKLIASEAVLTKHLIMSLFKNDINIVYVYKQ